MLKRFLAGGVAIAAAFVIAMPLIAGDGEIMVADPFARETPPNAKVGGAFMTIMNHGNATRLVAAQSPVADRVEIHNHTMDEQGVMRMREVEGGLPIGRHETVTLKPGGLHVMFMNLKEPLEKGETVDLTLEFEDGSTVDVVVPILSIAAGSAMQHHDMKHDKMKHEH